MTTFSNISSTFKTSHLSGSKFSFLSFCPFCTKNPNVMPILPLTPKLKPRCFRNNVVLESGVKLAFFVRKEQSKRNPKFDTHYKEKTKLFHSNIFSNKKKKKKLYKTLKYKYIWMLNTFLLLYFENYIFFFPSIQTTRKLNL